MLEGVGDEGLGWSVHHPLPRFMSMLWNGFHERIIILGQKHKLNDQT